jgi:maleate cis-trans isomerase
VTYPHDTYRFRRWPAALAATAASGSSPVQADADEAGDRGAAGASASRGPTRRQTGEGVGVLVPFDFALDRELWRWVPDDVQLHVTRTPFVPSPVTEDMARAISQEAPVRQATRDVLLPEPGVVAYACASGSFVDGAEGEAALIDTMTDAGAPRAVTTAGAVVQALAALRVRRVSLVTPYIDTLNRLLVEFLDAYGMRTVASTGLGLVGQIWRVSAEELVDSVRAVDRPEADAVFISCTNLSIYDLIAPLERELGKPVITANQATMWSALRALGLRASGPGQWLVERAPLATAATAPPPMRSTSRPSPVRPQPDGGAATGLGTSLHKIRVRLPDEPGALARLSEAVAGAGGNILSLAVHGYDSSSVVDELYVIANPPIASGQLADVVTAGTGAPVHAMPADPHDLVDTPTRALELAVQAREHPDGLPQALRALVHADRVHGTTRPPDADDHQLALPAASGLGWLVATRRWAPFTPTERARAEAFLRTLTAASAEPVKRKARLQVLQRHFGVRLRRVARLFLAGFDGGQAGGRSSRAGRDLG